MKYEIPTSQKAETQTSVIDMTAVLQKIPPIEGVFSPSEEVQKLWSIPKGDRKEAIILFKDKLVRQREAWGMCSAIIEQQINDNPDLSQEEMFSVIDDFASHYGFADEHIITGKLMIKEYIDMHKKILEYREEFPDNIDLVNKLTGVRLSESEKDRLEVVIGPMSIDICCSKDIFCKIYGTKNVPGGFATTSDDPEPIYYSVINKDYDESNHEFYKDILIHERRHHTNKIGKGYLYGEKEVQDMMRKKHLDTGIRGFIRHQISENILKFERVYEDELFEKYLAEEDFAKKTFLLKEFMRFKREEAFSRVKDEIFARKIQTTSYSPDTLSDYFKPNNRYDFLKATRFAHDINDMELKKLWEETSQKILIDEYIEIIHNAILSFDELRNSGYSQEETIAMLSDKRLSEWPKTVKRLSEESRKSGQGN